MSSTPEARVWFPSWLVLSHFRAFDLPGLRRVDPNLGIASDDLARAMVHAGLHGTGYEMPS